MAKSESAKRKKKMDTLWSDVVKARAGYKSEISGRDDGALAAHHIFGKPNLALRYNLDNGICLLNHAEHIYGVHNQNDSVRRWQVEEAIRDVKGDHYDFLVSLYGVTSTQFAWEAKEAYLREELRLAKIKHDGAF